MARSRRRRPSARARDELTARNEATVRFGPEHSALKALLSEAATNYQSDLTSADAAAKSTIGFAQKSEPKVRSIFDEARNTTAAAQQDVQTAFGNVGAGADPFRAATARETALGTQRAAQARAGALNELESRQLEATAGRQYARTAATEKYRTDLGSLQTKLSDLGDREGAYVVGRMGALGESRAGRKTQTRVQRLAARNRSAQSEIDFQRKIELEREKDRLRDDGDGSRTKGLSGNKPATRAELRGFQSNFAKALSYAKQYKPGQRHVAAQELIEGRTPTKETSAVPSIGDQLALSTALDMAFDGHVSRANARKLKAVGIRVADVQGATSYAKWYPRSRRPDTAGNPNVSR